MMQGASPLLDSLGHALLLFYIKYKPEGATFAELIRFLHLYVGINNIKIYMSMVV